MKALWWLLLVPVAALAFGVGFLIVRMRRPKPLELKMAPVRVLDQTKLEVLELPPPAAPPSIAARLGLDGRNPLLPKPPAPKPGESGSDVAILRPDDPNNPLKALAEKVPVYGPVIKAANTAANAIEEATGVDISGGKYVSAGFSWLKGKLS